MKKKILAVLVMGTMIIGSAYAKQADKTNLKGESSVTIVDPKDNFAKIEFDTLRINLGKFSATDPIRKCSFKFTNTGTAPLVIHQALASCGCTIPNYSKTPIKPGNKGQIDVTYNGTGKFPGHFVKTITIRSNATNEVVRLTIEGDMIEK